MKKEPDFLNDWKIIDENKVRLIYSNGKELTVPKKDFDGTFITFVTSPPEVRSENEFGCYCTAYMICNRYGVDTKPFNFDKAPEMFEGKENKDVRSVLVIFVIL